MYSTKKNKFHEIKQSIFLFSFFLNEDSILSLTVNEVWR